VRPSFNVPDKIRESHYSTCQDLLLQYEYSNYRFSIFTIYSRGCFVKMANELLTSFLGAIQASLSVLLVISYGVIAAQFNILSGDSTKQISALCVRMFLPALMITNLGSQLHADTGVRYIPILCIPCMQSLFAMQQLIRRQCGDSFMP